MSKRLQYEHWLSIQEAQPKNDEDWRRQEADQTCWHCRKGPDSHAAGRCLFQSTAYAPWKEEFHKQRRLLLTGDPFDHALDERLDEEARWYDAAVKGDFHRGPKFTFVSTPGSMGTWAKDMWNRKR